MDEKRITLRIYSGVTCILRGSAGALPGCPDINPNPHEVIMTIHSLRLATLALLAIAWSFACTAQAEENGKKKLVIVAGKPSHPPRMHEFKAGTMLLADCLKNVDNVKTHIVTGGWPKDESIFDNADGVIFYMDGGGGHEVVQEGQRRLSMVDGWAKRGVGLDSCTTESKLYRNKLVSNSRAGSVAIMNTCSLAIRSGNHRSPSFPRTRSPAA